MTGKKTDVEIINLTDIVSARMFRVLSSNAIIDAIVSSNESLCYLVYFSIYLENVEKMLKLPSLQGERM